MAERLLAHATLCQETQSNSLAEHVIWRKGENVSVAQSKDLAKSRADLI